MYQSHFPIASLVASRFVYFHIHKPNNIRKKINKQILIYAEKKTIMEHRFGKMSLMRRIDKIASHKT